MSMDYGKGRTAATCSVCSRQAALKEFFSHRRCDARWLNPENGDQWLRHPHTGEWLCHTCKRIIREDTPQRQAIVIPAAQRQHVQELLNSAPSKQKISEQSTTPSTTG